MPEIFSGFEMSKERSKDRQFRSFMMKLSKEFRKEDLKQLKYSLKKTIPAGRMQSLQEPLDVFCELEERDIVAPGKLDALRELLADIERPHLISMIDEFDDSSSAFPLKAKARNYLEMDGYRLSVEGGRHFETSGGEFVEVKSGASYALKITNSNCYRCLFKINVDGYQMFPQGFLLPPKGESTIERPSRKKQKFKFFAIADAPEGSGINRWRKEQNGLIEVVFIPEKVDMRITCVARGHETQVLSCSSQTIDSDFYSMVSSAFGADNVTIMVKSWKPLRRIGIKLGDYGIRDGTSVDVNFGGRGGVSVANLSSAGNLVDSKKDPKWRAGATTLEDESKQDFMTVEDFPRNEELAVSLSLRLVARADERGLPSTGNCTPLARATLIPPPVPV